MPCDDNDDDDDDDDEVDDSNDMKDDVTKSGTERTETQR